jgi:hypothetical protein
LRGLIFEETFAEVGEGVRDKLENNEELDSKKETPTKWGLDNNCPIYISTPSVLHYVIIIL